eukprot:GHUV01032648.1.p2 GENE.GHUV01032648.1~~GHUV01032648.1.p2  ORF type:complete len:139 (-),score=29.52 GHUV01032648.1:73-489(-)
MLGTCNFAAAICAAFNAAVTARSGTSVAPSQHRFPTSHTECNVVCSDPVERLKLVVAFAVGGFRHQVSCDKPFNPILVSQRQRSTAAITAVTTFALRSKPAKKWHQIGIAAKPIHVTAHRLTAAQERLLAFITAYAGS